MSLVEAACHKCLGQVSQGVKKAEVKCLYTDSFLR